MESSPACLVRLLPNPPAVKTLLLAYDRVEDAAATVSGVIAQGMVPAALEMMDKRMIVAVENFVHADLPVGAEAILLAEVAGTAAAVEDEAALVEEVARANNATQVRIAKDEAERQLLWKGRKSAFGAVAQAAPDYYLHDTVVPRTKLVEVLAEVYRIGERHGLTMLNVFHAGDGNLHPLMAFDGSEPGMLERVKAAADELVEVCVAAGGVLSGEHGIGLEKRDLMPLLFTTTDLDAQARVRESFDPEGRSTRTRCCRSARGASTSEGRSRRGHGCEPDTPAAGMNEFQPLRDGVGDAHRSKRPGALRR